MTSLPSTAPPLNESAVPKAPHQVLQELFAKHGVSQAEVATSIGMQRQNLNPFLTGKSVPTKELISKIAGHLGITADGLMADVRRWHAWRKTPQGQENKKQEYSEEVLARFTARGPRYLTVDEIKEAASAGLIVINTGASADDPSGIETLGNYEIVSHLGGLDSWDQSETSEYVVVERGQSIRVHTTEKFGIGPTAILHFNRLPDDLANLGLVAHAPSLWEFPASPTEYYFVLQNQSSKRVQVGLNADLAHFVLFFNPFATTTHDKPKPAHKP